jgi:hypothetical protein
VQRSGPLSPHHRAPTSHRVSSSQAEPEQPPGGQSPCWQMAPLRQASPISQSSRQWPSTQRSPAWQLTLVVHSRMEVWVGVDAVGGGAASDAGSSRAQDPRDPSARRTHTMRSRGEPAHGAARVFTFPPPRRPPSINIGRRPENPKFSTPLVVPVCGLTFRG